MELTAEQLIDKLPIGTQVLARESLSNAGAWSVEVAKDGGGIEFNQRDPEVVPRLQAVVKAVALCDANECRSEVYDLPDARSLSAFIVSQWGRA